MPPTWRDTPGFACDSCTLNRRRRTGIRNWKISYSQAKKWTDTIRTDRVVVIEWLPANDRKTGEELVQRLADWKGPHGIEFYRCDRAESVLRALRHVTERVSVKGIPILHIESHGAGGPQGGISGDGKELLSWHQLRAPLRELNIATRFQLLVVGAACYGDGFIWGIGEIAASPFLACIGFPREVSVSAVFDVLLEFYRALLVRHENIEDAVASAQQESHDPKKEYLRFTTARSLLIEALNSQFKRDAALSTKERFARDVSLTAQFGIQRGKAASYSRVVASDEWSSVAAADKLTTKILALDLFPENRKRFDVDIKALMREARRPTNSRET